MIVLRPLTRTMAAGVVCLAVCLLSLQAAAAQDRRQNAPGQFDFYVLALSWSPSFCEQAGPHADTRANQPQCRTQRPYAFVVHGLWPQYERGFPEFCRRDAPRPDRGTISGMLDLMPSVNLIFHEWERHGTCSGLSLRAYFDTIRKARAGVKIPDAFVDLQEPLTVTPAAVEAAFVTANPGLSANGVSVACNGRRLSEVRICLSKDLGFRDCGAAERRACRAERVTMPPLRRAANATREAPAER